MGSLVSSRGSQLYVAGAPRFNHTGKVIVFTLRNTGNLTVLQALLGEQVSHTHTDPDAAHVSSRVGNITVSVTIPSVPLATGPSLICFTVN